jgi:iduronate 2-sulfatase
MQFKKLLAFISILFLFPPVLSGQSSSPPNILFIAVDDLRPELGVFGASHIVSPRIDKLGESGMVFTRAYCNIPVCGASRASILSGIRPNRQRFLNHDCWQENDIPGQSIPSFPGRAGKLGLPVVSGG